MQKPRKNTNAKLYNTEYLPIARCSLDQHHTSSQSGTWTVKELTTANNDQSAQIINADNLYFIYTKSTLTATTQLDPETGQTLNNAGWMLTLEHGTVTFCKIISIPGAW